MTMTIGMDACIDPWGDKLGKGSLVTKILKAGWSIEYLFFLLEI